MIYGIRIQGKCFEENTDLRFFRDNMQRVAVVYGRNGSGKSTISRAFATYDNDHADTEDALENSSSREAAFLAPFETSLITEQTDDEQTPRGQKQNVLVFNESFIDHKVKIEGDGLGAVVLFGEQAEIHDKIDDTRARLGTLQTNLVHSITARETAENEERSAISRIDQALKQGWADRSRKILDSSIATPSWSKTRASLAQTAPAKGRLSDLLYDLDQRIQRYLDVSKSERIEGLGFEATLDKLQSKPRPQLLSKTLEIPTGKGLRSKIASSLENHEEYVHKARQIFSDPEVTNCPICQREVSPLYRAELLDAIEAAIDDEVEIFKSELENAKLPEALINEGMFDVRLGEERIGILRIAINDYNGQVFRWNEVCELKKTQMYRPLDWDSHNFRETSRALEESLYELEKAMTEWNTAVHDRDIEQTELLELNDQVSRYESAEVFDFYASALRKLESSRQGESSALDEERNTRNILSELLARVANVQIAADEINTNMQAIFAERGRLELELNVAKDESEETVYHVLNRGRRLRPEDLSVGERNILALTYFFTTVRRELENLGKDDSLLVVLDDPISSVDVDNRLGIHGFLEVQMRQLLGSSESVRCILLTHDLTAARDLAKAAADALPLKSATQSTKWTRICYQLQARSGSANPNPLEQRNLGNLNEYKSLLQVAYNYASLSPEQAEDSAHCFTIGNIVRRILEAFSTFIYGAGILDPVLSEAYAEKTNGRILAIDLRAGHRGFLHDSSHSEDGLTSLRDFGGFSGLSTAEQVQHVRRVIALMCTLQDVHMRRYLPQGSEQDVKQWQNDLMSS